MRFSGFRVRPYFRVKRPRLRPVFWASVDHGRPKVGMSIRVVPRVVANFIPRVRPRLFGWKGKEDRDSA